MIPETSTGPTATPASGRAFVTTRWTCVLAARGTTPAAKQALSDLCAMYWQPVFTFLRREGRTDDAARELTQEFFRRILARDGFAHADPERGRFRSFLLGAVKHFLADMRDRERAARRGGGAVPEPFTTGDGPDTATALQIADDGADVPDTYFDRQWAFALMERAFAQLAAEQNAAGKAEQYGILKPWLIGETAAQPQSVAAQALGITEGAVKVAIHRLRNRFRELIRTEVAQTVPEPAAVEAELRYLVEVLAAG